MNPILRGALFLLGAVLLLVGLLAGGCSAFFTPDIFQGGDYMQAVQMIWALGLLLAALGCGLGVLILRRLMRPKPPTPHTFDPP